MRIAVGLALCLFSISAVLSFMQALQRNQFEDIRTFESFDLQMPLDTQSLEEATFLSDDLERIAGVSQAFVYAEIPIIAEVEDGTTLAGRIRAIQSEGRFLEQLNSYRGTLFADDTLSVSYTNNSLVPLGEQLKITFLKKGKQATVIPTLRELPVDSIYYTTSYDFDQSTFLCTLSTLQTLNPDVALFIGMFVQEESVDTVKKRLLESGYTDIATWKEVNASLYGAMELEQKMMSLMLFLMVLVIIVHVRSSSRRLLLAKQREIAMLRSMGMSAHSIQRLFVLQALLVALLGCLAGTILSYGAIALYPYVSQAVYHSMGVHLVLSIRSGEMVFLNALILLFSMLASYQGTHRILKADIMEMFAHDEIS